VHAWQAFALGGLSSAALYIGEALARPLGQAHRVVGLVMAFGAGTLLSAVAYELIPDSSLGQGWGLALGFGLGAVVYYVGDRLVDGKGGQDRQQIESVEATSGSGAGMFLGALLDGLPEAFVLGIGMTLGDGVSVAFVGAVFVSNVPQGIAGTTSLLDAGYSSRHIFRMWTALTVACALAAVAGFVVGDAFGGTGIYVQAFAAGAVLTMLADSMMPEAFQHGGKAVGLLTVLGYAVAAALSALD
jgi:ZIP family zinc transporter